MSAHWFATSHVRWSCTWSARAATSQFSVLVEIGRAALDAGHSVGERSRLAGFGSPETFRRVFVSNLGVSPKGVPRQVPRGVVGPGAY